MPGDRSVIEQHGCIVCGKLYDLLVVFNTDGRMVDFAVTRIGGRKVLGQKKVFVTCDSHSEQEIEIAIARWSSRAMQEEDSEEQ